MSRLSAVPPSDLLTIIAIILGPVLALLTQRVLDLLREKKNRRAQLFFDLMSSRATPLAANHINALNSIDFVFDRWRDHKVRSAWREVMNQLNKAPGAELVQWTDRLNDLKVDLFRAIGKRIGYNFSTDYLKRYIYYPSYYGQMEADLLTIRKALTTALTDNGLNVKLIEPAVAAQGPNSPGAQVSPRA
jgi:hypothetical protein